jgi:hypothetical protein
MAKTVKMVRSRKTGKMRPVNAKRSRAARAAAKARKYPKKGGKLTAAHRRKISLGVKRARKSGRTASGRKAMWRKPKKRARK